MANQNSSAQPTKVVTGEVRGSYVNVFAPRENDQGEMEYSMTLLIPKKDKATLDRIKAAMDAAKTAKWGAKVPSGWNNPVHDGDGSKPMGGDYGEECKGHYVLAVKSKHKPAVVDANLNPVIDANDFMSGDYCRVSLGAYAYDNKKKGVGFGLNNVQVLRKGDPLGAGKSRAEDDFGVVEGGFSASGSAGAGSDDYVF